jgi:uncharacterized repeat protein (TIGR01451 family)
MKTRNAPSVSSSLKLGRTSRTSPVALFLRAGAFLVFFGLLVTSLYSGSSASPFGTASIGDRKANEETKRVSLGTKIDKHLSELFRPVRHRTALLPLVPQGGPETITTYQSDCTTANDRFTTNDTVCVKVSNVSDQSRAIYWINPDGALVQIDSVSPTTVTRQVVQLGIWKVYVVDSDGALRELQSFSVSDPQQPKVDLSVFKGSTGATGDFTAGGLVSYQIVVKNNGPDTASNVVLTDAVPTNTTYVSSSQDSGSFTRTQETPVTTWTNASMAPGASASFTFTYQINGGTPGGTIITNSVEVEDVTFGSPGPDELHPEDNTWTTANDVVAGGTGATCSLDCPNNITVTATTHGTGGGANVTYAAPDASGTCGTVSMSQASGSFFTTGTTTVTATSATGGGFCSFTVTVIDSPAPTITCPANITVTANSGQSQAFVPDPNGTSSDPGTPTATGTNVTVTGGRSDGQALSAAYPIGVTQITWTATECLDFPQCTDPFARSASCTQTITVISTDAPRITCPSNKTFTAPTGSCQITVLSEDIGLPSTTGTNVTVTNERSDSQSLTAPYPAGQTFITWTATNSFGSASCTQTITVIATDSTPPTLTVPPDVNATTSTCTATLDDELGVATATDNCTASVNITRTGVPTFSCPTLTDPNKQCESFVFPTGTTIITYTATDAAGNTTVGTQRVTVLESPAIPPTITAPADVTVNTGPGATSCGTVVADATLGTASASDNCPGVTVSRTGVPAGNNFPVGITTITYTATDASGNTATATQKVTVVDDTAPAVTAPGPVTLYTGAGATSCGVAVSNLNATFGTGSATDNCPGVGAVTRSGVPSGNNFPVGMTTLTYSATDAHGNTGSATQVVTVVDNTPPVISCPSNIVLEPTCPTGAKATYTAPVGTDNCPGATTARTAGGASGTVFPIGTTTVTYTVTDAAGNSTSCSFTVTVKTAAQTVQDMITAVQAMTPPLTGTQSQGLIAKLQAALDAINQGKTNVACNKLSDFISQVQSYINNGALTSAQGQPLINSANHVRNTIGCTNNPCT